MQIKKENILKAHKDGCSDVKKVIENLFPDVDFIPKTKYKINQKVMITLTIGEIDMNDDDQKYCLNIDANDNCAIDAVNEFEELWISEEELDALLARK